MEHLGEGAVKPLDLVFAQGSIRLGEPIGGAASMTLAQPACREAQVSSAPAPSDASATRGRQERGIAPSSGALLIGEFTLVRSLDLTTRSALTCGNTQVPIDNPTSGQKNVELFAKKCGQFPWRPQNPQVRHSACGATG